MRGTHSAPIPNSADHILSIEVQTGTAAGMDAVCSGRYPSPSIISLIIYWSVFTINPHQSGYSAIGQFNYFFPPVDSGQTERSFFICLKLAIKLLFEFIQFLQIVVADYFLAFFRCLCKR